MKKKFDAMIAVVLCAACAVPALPVAADNAAMQLPEPDPVITVTGEAFSYDSEKALLISDAMAGADCYFVTGMEDFVFGRRLEGKAYTAPGVFVTGVNDKGEIMGRTVLLADTVSRLTDVDFQIGDTFTFAYSDEAQAREWYANASQAELDRMAFDNYDDQLRENMRTILGRVPVNECFEDKVGIDIEQGFRLKVTGNLMDTFGQDFEEVCRAETSMARHGDVHGHINGRMNDCFEVGRIFPNSELAPASDEEENEWRRIYHIYPYDTPENAAKADPELVGKLILDDGRICGVDCDGKYDDEQGCVHVVDLPGDANTDETVDIMDVVVTQKFIMGCRELTPQQKAGADVDQNGVVDSADSLNILKYAVGMIDSFDEIDAK